MFSVLNSECYSFGTPQLTQANPQFGSLIALVLQQVTTAPEALTYPGFCDLLRNSKTDIRHGLHAHFPLFQQLHRNLRQQLQQILQDFNQRVVPPFKNKSSLETLKQVVIQQCNFRSENSQFTVNALYHFLASAPNPFFALNLTLIFTPEGNCHRGVMYFPNGVLLRNFYWSYADTRTAIEILYDAVPVSSCIERETLLQDLSFDKSGFLIKVLQQNVDDFTWDLRKKGLGLRESVCQFFDDLQQHLEEKFEYLLTQPNECINIK